MGGGVIITNIYEGRCEWNAFCFFLRNYAYSCNQMYLYHGCVLYRVQIILPQSLRHYQDIFPTFAWDAVCRSRKTCSSVAENKTLERYTQTCLSIHESLPRKPNRPPVVLACRCSSFLTVLVVYRGFFLQHTNVLLKIMMLSLVRFRCGQFSCFLNILNFISAISRCLLGLWWFD